MTVKVGYVNGICPACGKVYSRPRPEDSIICDCYKFCPLCTPAYTVPMTPFTPDLTPSTYGLEEDFEKTINVLYVCNNHSPPYYSTQKPVEVLLT